MSVPNIIDLRQRTKTRREYLKKAVTSALVGPFFLNWLANPTFAGNLIANTYATPQSPAVKLRDLAAAKGKLFGTLMYHSFGGWNGTQGQISTDPIYRAAEVDECNWYVADGDCALRSVQPHSGSAYNYQRSDASNAYAVAHQMKWRAGPLVYDVGTFYLPAWWDRLSAADAQTALLNFITNTVSRYAGKVHCWQVVNEILRLNSAGGVTSNGVANLRNGRVVQKLGAGFYDLAFRAARAADPNAILFINDNTLENNNRSTSIPRRAAMLQLLDGFLARRVPVDAVGLQAHLGLVNSNTNDATLKAFVDAIAARGLKVMVTEMDVNDSSAPADFPSRDALVAEAYARFLNVMVPHSAVIGISTWGMNDKESWLSSFIHRADGLPLRPLPLDSNYAKKPAYTAIANAFG
jgi:endo-1,4-beta-xylanase